MHYARGLGAQYAQSIPCKSTCMPSFHYSAHGRLHMPPPLLQQVALALYFAYESQAGGFRYLDIRNFQDAPGCLGVSGRVGA